MSCNECKSKENYINMSELSITSTGHKKTAEIIFDLKTAKIISKIIDNKWSVNWKTRESLQKTLKEHIEACSND